MTQQILRVKVRHDQLVSANGRYHWAAKARRVRELRARGQLAVRGARLSKMQRARLIVLIGWPDSRRRDAANLSPTIKALVDGFVDAGLLPDDSDAHLVGPDLRAGVAGVKGHVALTFHFTPLADGDTE